MLTPLEKQLLSLSCMTSGPVYSEVLCRAVQRPLRGVVNVMGRLVSKNILIKLRWPDRYVIQSDLSQIVSVDQTDEKVRQLRAKSLLKAIRQWDPDWRLPGIPFLLLELSFQADSKKILTVLTDVFTYYLDTVQDDYVKRILHLSHDYWRNSKIPSVVVELEKTYLSVTSVTNSIWSTNRLIHDDDSFEGQCNRVVLLQELGLSATSQKSLEELKGTGNGDHHTGLMQWVQARQMMLSGNNAAARALLALSLKCLKRCRQHVAVSRVLLDVARCYGISGNYHREMRCIHLARSRIKQGRRPEISQLALVRSLEATVESGHIQHALQIVATLFDQASQFQWKEAMFFACCYAVRLAACLDRPSEAFQYAREIVASVDAVPTILIRRCQLVLSDLNRWYPREVERMAELINRHGTLIVPDYNQTFCLPVDENIALFLRQSQCLCDTLCIRGETSLKQDPEQAQSLLLKAKKLSIRLGDQYRWAKSVRLHQECSHSSGDIDGDVYPAGYVAWLNKMLNSQDYKSFVSVVQVALATITGIRSGGLLVLNQGKWRIADHWMAQNRVPGVRQVIRHLKSKMGSVMQVDEWTLIAFPESVSSSGYLIVELDKARTSTEHYAETVSALNALIKPIAILREAFLGQRHVFTLDSLPEIRDATDRIIGQTPMIKVIKEKIRQIANSPSTVHVWGETGTGKELVAEAIHRCSIRSNGPLVVFNCSTSTETMIDSELFGHMRGAFTGANQERKGVFQSAHRGTLFLDEIADLSLPMQARLLRVIQERKVRPVGADFEREIDVRIISATHKDLKEEVRAGRFRSDLYYRLVVIHLALPGLRERKADIPILAAHFLDMLSRKLGIEKPELSLDAVNWLKHYSWPGNIRELQNLIEVVINFARGQHVVTSEELRQWSGLAIAETPVTLAQASDRFQTDFITRTLLENDGNLTRSAEKLGISRQGLFKKMNTLGIIADGKERGCSG